MEQCRRIAICAILVAYGWFTDGAIAADNVELYAQKPIMQAASLSPDGTQVAFLSTINGRYHVVVERFKPKFSRYILYPGEELDFKWVEWANDDRLLVSSSYLAKRDLATNSSRIVIIESEESRLFSVGPLGQDLTAIIKPARVKEIGSSIKRELAPPPDQDNIVDWLVDDPNHVLIALDSDINGAFEVRRVDIRNGDFENVVDDASRYYNWVTDGAGNVRIGWARDENDKVLVKARMADDRWIAANEHDYVKAGFTPSAFSSEPDIAFAFGRNDNGIRVLRKVNIVTGEFVETVFEDEKYDAGGLWIDDSTHQPVGTTYAGTDVYVHFFDETMIKLMKNVDAALPDRNNAIVSASKNHRQLLILSWSGTDAGSYFIWDRDEKALSLYEDRYSNLGEGAFAPVEPIVYAARDGLEIPGYLTFPKGSARENLPTIVLPHGGPASRDTGGYWFLSHFLAAEGYAVFQPNFRGSSGYGEEFEKAGHGEWGGKMQDDVTDGANWLVEQGIADPERMCIVGWSYGGYAAAMGAVKTPDLYRCAASINGVLNLPRLISEAKIFTPDKRDDWIKQIGLEGESSRTVSPLHQAESIKVPMLIVHAADDSVVEIEQSDSMVKRLRHLNKKVEYVEVESGGHSLDHVDGRKKLLEALGRFLHENIGENAGENKK